MMISRSRFQLPSLLPWLLEQDAESITAASANQSAEAHNALRRSAATQHNKAKTYRATSLYIQFVSLLCSAVRVLNCEHRAQPRVQLIFHNRWIYAL